MVHVLRSDRCCTLSVDWSCVDMAPMATGGRSFAREGGVSGRSGKAPVWMTPCLTPAVMLGPIVSLPSGYLRFCSHFCIALRCSSSALFNNKPRWAVASIQQSSHRLQLLPSMGWHSGLRPPRSHATLALEFVVEKSIVPRGATVASLRPCCCCCSYYCCCCVCAHRFVVIAVRCHLPSPFCLFYTDTP